MKFQPPLRIRSCAHLAALALATGLTGCLSDPDSNPSTNQASTPAQNIAEGIYGTMLYAKNLGGGHRVEFYDFGDGNIAIRESGSMDESAKAVLPSMQIGSLQEAYLKLNPQAASVPETIRKADLASKAKVWKPGSGPEFTVVPVTTRPVLAKTASQACSPDHFGDGWGGDWFINNFCLEGNFRWCNKNLGGVTSGSFNRPWWKWMQMEGDFDNAGHVHATISRYHWWYGYDWKRTFVDHDILPRRWESWTQGGPDQFWFNGSSPCSHMHVNFMWN